jgi:CheY-like chemotaxis protein
MCWFLPGNPPMCCPGVGSGPSSAEYQPVDRSAIMESVSTGSLPADVLIVEDDPLLRLDLEDTIQRLGVKRVRSAGNAALALQLIAEREPDLALLDVGLVEEESFVVAERLVALGIPFVFVTGYSAGKVPQAYADRLRLTKPCSAETLQTVLRRFGAADR